jgi:hypothetical protein
MVQFLGLFLALVPSAITLLIGPETYFRGILAANVLFPLIGSWMLLIRMKNKFDHVMASIGLGIVFFLVNVFVAVFVGCSRHPLI